MWHEHTVDNIDAVIMSAYDVFNIAHVDSHVTILRHLRVPSIAKFRENESLICMEILWVCPPQIDVLRDSGPGSTLSTLALLQKTLHLA